MLVKIFLIRYFREWESILNLLIILSFPLISFHQNPLEEGGFKVWSWQYHVAGIGISITWFINMILVGKVPKLGIYIHMFMTVGSSFVHFFLSFISLLLAFGLAFSVIFPDEEGALFNRKKSGFVWHEQWLKIPMLILKLSKRAGVSS